jgi:diacylglycerol kinase family enzyme
VAFAQGGTAAGADRLHLLGTAGHSGRDNQLNSGPNPAGEALHQRLVAVLNTGSGSCDEHSAAEVETIFGQAGMAHARIIVAGPTEIEQALEKAVEEADVLVVLGGDGTIRTAIEKQADRRGYLVPLPGGTMNLLPHALYGERDWRAALADTLADPEVQVVGGGRAEGYRFFVAALLGEPALWADAREALRAGDIVEAARRGWTAIRRSRSDPLRYVFGDTLQGTAEAVAVICPLISKVMGNDEPVLEAAAVDPETALAALRLGFYALLDDWRGDPSVSRAKAKSVRVTGHGRVPAILDGEKVKLGRSVSIEFVPGAFCALVPAEKVAPGTSSGL